MTRISIVTPVFNEEKSIPPLYDRLCRVFKSLEIDAEFIFIDDGSRDGSSSVIRQLRSSDPRVKLISLTRNFGQQMALTAGLKAAQGDAAITMDSDLQHPPEVIPQLMEAWRAGSDIVSAVRKRTHHDPFFKKIFSLLFYRTFNFITTVPLVENSPEFRLLSRRVVDILSSFPERHRLVRGLIAWSGFQTTTVEFYPDDRSFGTTGFSAKKMLSMGVDAIISFSSAPLYIAAISGFFLVSAGLLYFIYILGLFFLTDRPLAGWTSVVSLILVIGGFHMILTAIVGIYVGKTFEEVKKRPLYVVESSLGIENRNLL